MAAETMKRSRPPPAEEATPEEGATPASKVPSNDDLLGEILHRVDSPTTLVRAALASKRWLRRASDRAFLRGFRERHPPRLLGFYVAGDCMPYPDFVPMPPDTELTAALRRAGSVFADIPSWSSHVWDIRNGRILFDFTEKFRLGLRKLAVRDTLRHPDGTMAVLQPPPTSLPQSFDVHAVLLPDDDSDDATCYRVDVHQHNGRKVAVEVRVLRSGDWSVLCSAKAELAVAPERIPMITLLAAGAGKVYMVAVTGYIIGVELATASLFTIDFPQGVTYEHFGSIVLCRGDNSVLYLSHVRGDKLTVWLRKMDDDHAREWVLRDTVSLKETCGHLIPKQGSEPADGETETFTSGDVVGAGDNAEFVFLELGVGDTFFVVNLHLATRRAQKVYQRDPDNDEIIQVYPFFMVWPPVFPDQGDQELSYHG